jgi:hypothetical protein
MAHTIVRNTFVGTPKLTGGIWRYPQNIVLPTDAYTARPGGSTRLGGVSDDGVTWMSERNTTKKRDWNGDKIRSLQESKDDSFKITYIEFLNPNVISEVYGYDNVTTVAASVSHGTQITAKSNADVLGHYGYVVDTFDGPSNQLVRKRRVLPDAQVDKVDDVAEKPGDWSVYTVTYDLFPDSQGNTSYIYYELADKIVPSVWDLDIVGSAGTFIITVDGQATSAIAYNASTSAVDTALELLSTVGSGNATVAGTAGDYHITLALGGTLSAVGSGGATANVVLSA